METIQGKVTRIIYPRDGRPDPATGFVIFGMKPRHGKEFRANGNIPSISEGVVVELEGDWVTHPRYGESFKVSTFREVVPASAKGIESYLASGIIGGIGPVYAQKLVEAFGEKTLEVIDKQPSRLFGVEGIGRKRVEKILAGWARHKDIADIMVFLKEYDISNALAGKIYKQYGAESISTIRSNPYRLAEDIDGVGFKSADRIAISLGLEKDSPDRARSGLLFALEEGTKNGHTYLERAALVPMTAEMLEVSDNLVDEALSTLVKEEKVFFDYGAVYLPVQWYCERGVAGKVSQLSSRRPMVSIALESGKINGKVGFTLDSVQEQAVFTALNSSITVITGGPGTGKTTIVKAIIAGFEDKGMKVLLAAPTGRASKRLNETTDKTSACTIHRLLGLKPGEGYEHDADDPLRGDVLIVDECSMIDVMLMHGLLKAVPDTMRVILVGDVDQLPSVGCGNVLRDIIDSGCVPVVRLTKIYRQALDSGIVRGAHSVNEGKMPSFSGNKDFYFLPTPPETMQETIVNLVTRRIPGFSGFGPRDIQVLTPMHVGASGVDELNRALQEEMNPDGTSLTYGRTTYRPGDKVMVLKNNYDKDTYNGDIGFIRSVDVAEGEMEIDIDGELKKYSTSELDEISLAYACTIHKSQGSEFPVTVIPLTTANYIMLQRNLLYTAITRAKKLCVMVGDLKAVAMAVRNNESRKRNSKLSERIKEYKSNS